MGHVWLVGEVRVLVCHAQTLVWRLVLRRREHEQPQHTARRHSSCGHSVPPGLRTTRVMLWLFPGPSLCYNACDAAGQHHGTAGVGLGVNQDRAVGCARSPRPSSLHTQNQSRGVPHKRG